ncbi:hypothetical protein [Nitrospira sp. BLG_2]|uniref:hypothetical protein n=1 Tax=Nitrospira sp. BLG_2 TaxID=3397507 RepID=UPI003B99D208
MTELFIHPNDPSGASAKKGANAVTDFEALCDKNSLIYEKCSQYDDWHHKDRIVHFPEEPVAGKNWPLGTRKVDIKSAKSNRRGGKASLTQVCLELRGTKGGGWIFGNEDKNFIAFQHGDLFYHVQVNELKSYCVMLHDQGIIDLNAEAKVKEKGDYSEYEDFGVFRRPTPDKKREKFMYVPLEHLTANVTYQILD